ncbi:MAG: hypothetical protein RIS97_560, partial [Pseudomonadota bacterium]
MAKPQWLSKFNVKVQFLKEQFKDLKMSEVATSAANAVAHAAPTASEY